MDTTNKFMVCAKGNEFAMLRQPGNMSRDDALNLAAWLVAMADRDGKFPAILEAVQNT